VRTHREFLAGEVLATSVDFAEVAEPTLAGAVTGDAQVRVLVRAGG
jgi:hypothetical protein